MKKNKKICGLGINDSDTPIILFEKVNKKRKIKWKCPYYDRWFNMLHRCYNKKYNNETYYKKVKVCEEWLLFSNFKSWMEKQDWEGKQLDKDIIGDGTLYSPDTCCFVSSRINTLITEIRKNNTKTPNIRKRHNKYEVQVSDGRKLVCKSFNSFKESLNFWIEVKIGIIKTLDVNDSIKNKLFEYYQELYLKFLTDGPDI